MWSASAPLRLLALIAASSCCCNNRSQHHVSAFLVRPATPGPSTAVTPRTRAFDGVISCRLVQSYVGGHLGTSARSRAGRPVSMASTETDQMDSPAVNVDGSNAQNGDDAYQPDRGVESQAYQSNEGWQLKYHDIKTRRDAADKRAKVGHVVFCAWRAKNASLP